MKTKIVLSVIFFGSFFLQSCLKTNSCPYADLSISAGATEVNNLNGYLTANSITALKHSNGFFYEVVQAAEGDETVFDEWRGLYLGHAHMWFRG